MRIGVFGGTFNPIHYGHLRAAEDVREKIGLARILFIPSGNPPLRTGDIAGSLHRLRMTRLAARNNPCFNVLDIEYRRRGKSYTVYTLKNLLKTYKGSELFFILGIDTFLDIPNWRKPEDMISLANMVIVSRPGKRFTDLRASPYFSRGKNSLAGLDRGDFSIFETALVSRKKLILLRIAPLEISATEIRKLIREGKSVKYLLPEAVESYIISNKLYRQDSKALKRGGGAFKKQRICP